MERLSGFDASFLYLEGPTNPMHVAAAAVFDPSTMPGGYQFSKILDLVESRLHLIPPFRRRLLEIPFQLHHPLWIEDPDFDLEYHVRRAALPRPGGPHELADLAADVMGRHLDRRRPLWEMYVVEGLEHDRIALIAKTHHAAIDGVSGAELTVNLLDLQPEPAAVAPPGHPWKPDRIPSDAELVAHALHSLSRQPMQALKAARRTTELALNLRRHNRQAEVSPPPSPFSAPRTSFNVALTSPQRRFAFAELPLEEVKAVKNAFGGKVNDVVLAICAGGLRRYLDAKGELPDEPLVAMVPISVRTEDEKGTMGNRVSSMLTSLATDIEDPLERLHAICEGTGHAKEQEKAISASTLTDWSEFAAPAVAALAARLYSRTRAAERMRPIFNVTISNVPGPPVPLYSAGARLVAMYPMGPVVDGASLNITVMSYIGSMYFGLVAGREAVPDVWALADALRDSLQELTKLVGDASGNAATP